MEIKTETKQFTYTRDITRYVAYDGKEFMLQSACERYESEKKFEDLNIEICKEAKDTPNPCIESPCPDTYDYLWYRPKNKEELDSLNLIFKTSMPESQIGRWVCIETQMMFGYDYPDDSSYSSLTEGIEYIKKFLSKFGYDVIIKEKDKAEKEEN